MASYDEYEAAASFNPAEDDRVALMRKFVDLTNALDEERQIARQRDEKIAALSADRESLRDTLLNALAPNQKAPTEAQSKTALDELMKRASR